MHGYHTRAGIPSPPISHRQYELSVKTSCTTETAIQAVGPIGRCNDKNMLASGSRKWKAVKASKQRSNHPALHAATLRRVTSGCNCINIVDEDDCRRMRNSIVENHPKTLLAFTRHASNGLRSRDLHRTERMIRADLARNGEQTYLTKIHPQLSTDRPSKPRFSAARRAVKENSSRRVDPEMSVELWVKKREFH